MLQSFRGIIDQVGLCSFREESERPRCCPLSANLAEFWAVVDTTHLPTICDAVRRGDRRAALSLLWELSVSVGWVHQLR
ncbi:MAG: hypothetical protein KDA87_00565 [Planctomycetales bacterium]|nr:hypothetical protein [Planctomycetales bacterium]